MKQLKNDFSVFLIRRTINKIMKFYDITDDEAKTLILSNIFDDTLSFDELFEIISAVEFYDE